MCPEVECELVYFGDRGLELRRDQVRVVPGYKTPADGFACYCFLHRAADIAREVRESGSSSIADSIRNQVANNDCACEVRNPSGKCCLPEVKRIIDRANKERQS